jgi:DNA-binding LytR/AlgR family response regulator
MALTALIVDDEPLARDELRYLLEKTGRVTVLAEAGSGPEALIACRELQPNVLFLDVQMPEMTGFELARQLLRDGGRPAIIFATAYDEYALQAFEAHAQDYLLKPFDPVRIDRAVQRLAEIVPAQNKTLQQLETFLSRENGSRSLQRLPLERNGRILLISPTDLLYASSAETGTLVRTRTEEYWTSLTLQELEERLPPNSFCRVHRQYIVNLERATEFIPWPGGTASLVLDDRLKTQVPIARTKVRQVKELLGMS